MTGEGSPATGPYLPATPAMRGMPDGRRTSKQMLRNASKERWPKPKPCPPSRRGRYSMRCMSSHPGPPDSTHERAEVFAMSVMTLAQALNAALDLALEDPRVVLMGEDIGVTGGVFRITDGLQQKYGTDRVIDTPVAESGHSPEQRSGWRLPDSGR